MPFSENISNILNKKSNYNNSLQFSNNLIEAGINKNYKLPSNTSTGFSLDLFKLNSLDKLQEDEINNDNFQNNDKFKTHQNLDFLSVRLCKIELNNI